MDLNLNVHEGGTYFFKGRGYAEMDLTGIQ